MGSETPKCSRGDPGTGAIPSARHRLWWRWHPGWVNSSIRRGKAAPSAKQAFGRGTWLWFYDMQFSGGAAAREEEEAEETGECRVYIS